MRLIVAFALTVLVASPSAAQQQAQAQRTISAAEVALQIANEANALAMRVEALGSENAALRQAIAELRAKYEPDKKDAAPKRN